MGRHPRKGKKVIRILRHDQGTSQDPGSYSCMEEGCGWKVVDAGRAAPYHHGEREHNGAAVGVERENPKRKTPEEIKETNRIRKRRSREKVSGGPVSKKRHER